MEKYTIEMRYIYEIEVQDGQDFGEVLEQSLKTYYTSGVETDNVTLLSANTEVLEVVGDTPDELDTTDGLV